jgi:hypothetical protein
LLDGTGKIYVSSFKSGMAKSILGKLDNNKSRWNSNYFYKFKLNKKMFLKIKNLMEYKNFSSWTRNLYCVF